MIYKIQVLYYGILYTTIKYSSVNAEARMKLLELFDLAVRAQFNLYMYKNSSQRTSQLCSGCVVFRRRWRARRHGARTWDCLGNHFLVGNTYVQTDQQDLSTPNFETHNYNELNCNTNNYYSKSIWRCHHEVHQLVSISLGDEIVCEYNAKMLFRTKKRP